MSRRAKCLVIAIFLVLLAIPAGYMALCWRPVAPLEFQAVAFHSAKDSLNPEISLGYGHLEVLIINKSRFPIRFSHGYLERVDDSSPRPVILEHAERSTESGITIPPGKFVRVFSGTWDPRQQQDGGIRRDRIQVQYYWLSGPRAVIDDWIGWFHRKRNPDVYRGPGALEDHTLLIPPPDSATVEP